MKGQLENLKKQCLEAISKANDLNQLQEVETRYLGRKGELTNILRNLKDLPDDQKKIVGKLGNEVKTALEQKIANQKSQLEKAQLDAQLKDPTFDVTAPGPEIHQGHIHPLSQVHLQLEL